MARRAEFLRPVLSRPVLSRPVLSRPLSGFKPEADVSGATTIDTVGA